ncbi:uncharacterized protein [Dysidea avara]|uniref:uncharacterized protein n=1 Tax=Dysidea avara TaxID=196820 RepID=UPI00332FFDE2
MMELGEVFAFVVLVIAVVHIVAINSQENTTCNPPIILPVNFHLSVQITVGSDRTFSCVIHSDAPLKKGYPTWTKRESLPHHVITTGECPTLSNTTCSNLTLINVSQSDGSGYYTIIAENECGSDNFTVNVEVVNPQFCLNATELPPLLVPPPPKVLAVKGQTVKVTATYKGDYSKYFLQAFWIVKNPDSMYILPGDNVSG